MNIKSHNRGRALKSVSFENVTTETDDEIRDAAYAFFGESHSSTFGTDVARSTFEQGVVTVKIWVD